MLPAAYSQPYILYRQKWVCLVLFGGPPPLLRVLFILYFNPYSDLRAASHSVFTTHHHGKECHDQTHLRWGASGDGGVALLLLLLLLLFPLLLFFFLLFFCVLSFSSFSSSSSVAVPLPLLLLLLIYS